MAKTNNAAQELATKMKEISISEFFEKNRHLLGYQNSTKALITIVKEVVDNSLDACDEAGILPEIRVDIKQTGIKTFKMKFEDNGPGIVESKVPLAFGKMLFGSKFHRLRQSRGTQGIGVSGALLYSQLTTGKSAKITSSTGDKIHEFDMVIDTVKNEPKVDTHLTNKNPDSWHGIKVELEAEGNYVERYQSIPEYLKQTAIANPHASIQYNGPNGKVKFDRVVDIVPKQPIEIKPHPYGIELGILRRMLASTRTKNIKGFLMNDFSRVGASSADQILRLAKIDSKRKAQSLDHEETNRLHKSMQMVKLIAPPTNCLSPLTEDLIINGLKKEINADYYVATTRPPTVYRGNPFQVEVGIAYGGELNPNTSAHLYRFSNKVPLLYHSKGCALTQSVEEVDWKRYGIQQSGGMPVGPFVILIHFASVWVPFTSEGKEAIANYPEIVKEVKLALQEAGRQMNKFIRQRRRAKQRSLRKKLFERYIPEVADGLNRLTGKPKKSILTSLEETMKSDKEVSKLVNGEDLEEAEGGDGKDENDQEETRKETAEETAEAKEGEE